MNQGVQPGQIKLIVRGVLYSGTNMQLSCWRQPELLEATYMQALPVSAMEHASGSATCKSLPIERSTILELQGQTRREGPHQVHVMHAYGSCWGSREGALPLVSLSCRPRTLLSNTCSAATHPLGCQTTTQLSLAHPVITVPISRVTLPLSRHSPTRRRTR